MNNYETLIEVADDCSRVRRFPEPSDGLEPSTPPYHGLPPATSGNPRQPFSPV
jgi:hypothetical protein